MPLSIEISKDELYLEGKREGLLESKREGFLEGKREGLLEGIELILYVLYREEGTVLMESIKKLDDIVKLERLKETMRNAKTIDAINEFIDTL
ncbi:MAG: Yae1 family protein [Nitrospirae bacterium]|nr:Yae1 family protein [Nitrospirota bacterium]